MCVCVCVCVCVWCVLCVLGGGDVVLIMERRPKVLKECTVHDVCVCTYAALHDCTYDLLICS